MISASATDPGRVRRNNEDCVKTDDKLGIYLLADGIGGHNTGEVASALAVETVHSVLRANLKHTDVDEYFELMVHSLHAAHWEIFTRAQEEPSMAGMGTTLVVVVVKKNQAYIVNAGDSRCYLFQRNYYPHPDKLLGEGKHKFTLLTNDHTVGNQLLAKGVPLGEIPKKQFHALTRSLGSGNPPIPDFRVIEIHCGDILLICSDGLTDMLSDSELELLLSTDTLCLDTLAAALVDAANVRGGRDNISVLLISQSSYDTNTR